MRRTSARAGAMILGVLAVAGCGGSSETSEATADAPPLDLATAPDDLFAAGIECRNPSVREYAVYDTPYRQLVCFGGPSGGPGDWSIEVYVFGSAEVFDGVMTDFCAGREFTSSGMLPPFEGSALGSNWVAVVGTTSATDPAAIPTGEELAAALGGTAIASGADACARVGAAGV